MVTGPFSHPLNMRFALAVAALGQARSQPRDDCDPCLAVQAAADLF